MANVDTFSTILRDGEELAKINVWLARYRCDELVRFHAKRVSADATRFILEASASKRLKILSSWPPHQAYLQETKTVPFVDITFTEPVDLDSFENQVVINGATVSSGDMGLTDNDHTLHIDMSSHDVTAAGQHEIILGTEVRHQNKLWKLCGERKVLWFTSEHGGSRGGEDIYEPDRSVLVMAKVVAEGQHDERKMLMELYTTHRIDPTTVVATQFTSGFPEYDRTVLYVIYKMGKVPYVKCANPEYKACIFQDGAPVEINVEIGLTESVEEESLEGNISVDGSTVAEADWTLSQDNKLLQVRFTPAEYKHHVVKIAGMKAGEYTRDWPYAHSFVIHVATGLTIPTHTGEVIGDTNLTAHETIISNQTLVTAIGTDYVLILDMTDGLLKKALISDFASAGGDMASATYDPAAIAEQLLGLTATQTMTNKTIDTANNTITVVEADISDLQSYLLGITGEPLSDLSDATITSIASGELLKWNGGAWINQTVAELGLVETSDLAAYYTAAQLDAGQLDNRYFTESELTGGALDGRYYSETEIDLLLGTKLDDAGTAITAQASATMATGDSVLFSDVDDSGDLKKTLVSGMPFDPVGTASTAVSDHEAAGNPHPVYLTQAEGDGLYAAIGPYDALGTATSEIGLHEAATDPHPDYLKQAEADALYAPTGPYDALGTATSEVGLHEDAANPHSQYLQNITAEDLGDLSNVSEAGASEGDYLKFSGGSWIADTSDAGGGGIDEVVDDLTPQLGGPLQMNNKALDAESGNDLKLIMGDSAGATVVSFRDLGGGEQAKIDSVGVGTFNELATVGGDTFTQTFADTSVIHAARSASGLSDSTTGTAAASLAPTGDTSASDQSTPINDNFSSLKEEIDKIISDLANTAQVVNKVLDNLQLGQLPD